ncbi:MAG: RecX family transcriptional regulator [Clostridia bacterium]|nr:RecX family transcriptional regulator [Clostridia bacterium]
MPTANNRPLAGEIRRITPVRGGSGLCVVLAISCGEQAEERSLTVSVEDYAGLRFLHPYAKAAGRILDGEQIAALDEAADRFSAVERGLNLLSYGDATRAGLARKLRTRGIGRDEAEAAADALAARGYIDEDAQVERFLRAELRKGRGPARILAAAREKQFGDEAIAHLRDAMAEVDFAEICAAVIEKKYGEFPEEPNAKKRAIAALMRLGFSYGEIKAACR